jgi:hypothetical protein
MFAASAECLLNNLLSRICLLRFFKHNKLKMSKTHFFQMAPRIYYCTAQWAETPKTWPQEQTFTLEIVVVVPLVSGMTIDDKGLETPHGSGINSICELRARRFDSF